MRLQRQQAARDRRGDVARAGAILARINEHPCAPHHVVVELAHLGQVSADQIDMRARPQQRAAHERFGGHGDAGNHIRLGDGSVQIVGHRDGHARQRQRVANSPRARSCAVPDQHAVDGRPRGDVRHDDVGGKAAGPHHQQGARVGAGEETGAERGIGGGLAERHGCPISATSTGAPVAPLNSATKPCTEGSGTGSARLPGNTPTSLTAIVSPASQPTSERNLLVWSGGSPTSTEAVSGIASAWCAARRAAISDG